MRFKRRRAPWPRASWGYLRLLITLALLLALGCASKDEAERVANDYYAAVRTGDFDRALTFFSAEFFAQTPKEVWLSGMKNLNRKLGSLEEFKLESWNVRKQAGTGPSTVVTLQYTVKYSKYPAQEAMTLVSTKEGGLKIHGLNINSPGFLVE